MNENHKLIYHQANLIAIMCSVDGELEASELILGASLLGSEFGLPENEAKETLRISCLALVEASEMEQQSIASSAVEYIKTRVDEQKRFALYTLLKKVAEDGGVHFTERDLLSYLQTAWGVSTRANDPGLSEASDGRRDELSFFTPLALEMLKSIHEVYNGKSPGPISNIRAGEEGEGTVEVYRKEEACVYLLACQVALRNALKQRYPTPEDTEHYVNSIIFSIQKELDAHEIDVSLAGVQPAYFGGGLGGGSPDFQLIEQRLPRAGAISIVGMTLATWCIEIVKANQAFVEQYLQLADKKASIPSSQTQGGNSASSGCLGALLVSITLLLGASSFT